MVWTMAVLAALVIVAALSWYAWQMWQQVWQQESETRAEQALAAKNEQKRLDHIHNSLNIIALSYLDKQVRTAEAGIRMAVLLDNLVLSCESKHRFAPLFEMYQRTLHIPTHDRWQQLQRSQRREYEQELAAIETEYSDSLRDIAQYVKNNPFGQWQPHEKLH